MWIFLLCVGVICTIFFPSQRDAMEQQHDSLPNFDTLWNYGKPEETERVFRELESRAASSGNRSYHAQLLTQIARTEGLQRKFSEAHRTLDTVEAMLTDDLTLARIRCDVERGRVYNSSGEKEKARTHFLAAWELALANHEDFYAIDAAHMMGIVEPPDEALAWNEKAIALAEKTTDKRAKGWLGSLANNTGWTYHDKGDYEKALEYFQKCLQWHEERQTGAGLKIARWSVARALRSLGRVEEALEQQQALLREYEADGGEGDGYVFEEIGECLLALNKGEEATPYFAQAYRQLSADVWLQANEPDRLRRLQQLGGVQDEERGK